MRIHPEAISPGRWPLLNPQKLGLSWIHFLNEIPLEIRDWQGYTRIWLPIIYNTIFIIEGNGMFLFAKSFKRPQCLNLKEPGSFVVMWIPQWWRCFCQRKLEKVHFSGKFRSVQLPSMGVFRLLSPFSGHTSKCLIRIYILYAFVLFCFYVYTLYTYFLFTHAGIEAGKDSVTERRMLIKTCQVRIRRHPLDSIGPLVGKGISVGSPSGVTMSSFQKCWKVSKVPVLANSSLVNMKGLMFVVWYPTFAKFGKKIWRPISSAPLSVAILWMPEQLLWSIGNRVESTGWSGILTPSIYGRLGWDLCTMLFRTGGVADHFLLDLVGAVKCRLQIRFIPPCFVCLTFACMVSFFDDFFVCWEHLGSQLVSLLDGVFHWFTWHGRVPTQDVYLSASG